MRFIVKRLTPSGAAAFSLLELSIVLVVMALIIGGVMQGTEMLRQTKLKGAIRDFSKFDEAFNQFRDVYKGKPGDITNASALWTGATNGNGDGYVGGPFISTPSAGTLTSPAEVGAAWRHLASANLITGNFTGTNFPASSINAASGFAFVSQNPIADATSRTNSPNYFDGNYGTGMKAGTFMILGATGGALPDRILLTPKDAYTIDDKIDDGLPAMGTVMTYLRYGTTTTGCVNNLAATTPEASGRAATYNTALTSVECNIIFINDIAKDN